MLEQEVETGEYSMPEAIIKFLLPIIREQSTYSDYAFGRVISEIALEVNKLVSCSSWTAKVRLSLEKRAWHQQHRVGDCPQEAGVRH